VEARKETRFLGPLNERKGFCPKKRNRVSTIDIKVNCGHPKRNPVSRSPEWAIAFLNPRKETGTQVVNIRVNCGHPKRNPVSRSLEWGTRVDKTKVFTTNEVFGGRSHFCPQEKKPGPKW
jgi:hypothetical protein